MKDYSEHGEQEHILNFFKGQKRGRFLDIGAFNGLQISNTRALLELGWTGVYIEANPPAFIQLLRHTRAFSAQCVLAAMMPTAGHTFLWDTTILKETDPAWAEGGQTCTCLNEHNVMDRVRQRFGVGCVTPRDIANVYGGDFDFVSLDIEGMDLPVLHEMGPVLQSAKLMCFEDTIPGTDFDPRYYNAILEACAKHGFTRTIARCKNNTLMART